LRRNIYILLLTLSLPGIALLSGCSSPGKGSGNEGVIEYEVSPVNPKGPFASMAPTNMILKYKDDKLVAEMNTGLSSLNIKLVSDNNKKRFTQYVRILNQKYSSTATSASLNILLKDLPEYDIKKTEDTKTIAGLTCNKAEIYARGTSTHLFDVWYTTEFKFSKPNWWNEFAGIDGMLMEYQMKRYNMDLHFIARNITSQLVDTADFNPKGNFKSISQRELNSYFDSFK